MKIRTRLTLRYSLVTALVLTAAVYITHLFSERNREKEFFRNLRSEAVTKANLFLEGRVDAGTMHSIYMNNREFIDEVEVAIYDSHFRLIYHDASQIDIVKETPEMLSAIAEERLSEFHEGEYQVVGMRYPHGAQTYIITAAAIDGYGIAKHRALNKLLLMVWIFGLLIISVSGYLLARGALSPVSRIVDEVELITDTSLGRRLEVKNSKDELGELSATFNDMLDRLERSFDNQKMFVSNISHELRTPLTALIAEFELTMLHERSTEQYRESIAQGLADARKIDRLANGLLDMAKADSDPDSIARKAVRVDEVLLEAREMVLKANRTYHIELLFDLDLEDESNITVFGNEYLLKTAFVNLMENNCKFSGDKTSSVSISHYGPRAIIRFSDTGKGMSREEAAMIFNPFYRGADSRDVTGHGIGMALVLKIVQLHQGEVSVNSHPGEGTVFVVELPNISH